MENPDPAYRTTVQMFSDWRERKVLERSRSAGERVLSYLLPMLWTLAVVVAGVAISW